LESEKKKGQNATGGGQEETHDWLRREEIGPMPVKVWRCCMGSKARIKVPVCRKKEAEESSVVRQAHCERRENGLSPTNWVGQRSRCRRACASNGGSPEASKRKSWEGFEASEDSEVVMTCSKRISWPSQGKTQIFVGKKHGLKSCRKGGGG